MTRLTAQRPQVVKLALSGEGCTMKGGLRASSEMLPTGAPLLLLTKSIIGTRDAL